MGNFSFFPTWSLLSNYSLIFRQNVVKNILISMRDGKTTAIRRVAVRETGVFQHHWGPVDGPATPLTITALLYGGVLGGSLNGTSLCRETLVFRAVFISIWQVCFFRYCIKYNTIIILFFKYCIMI